jgi:hypothetical protein
MAGEFDLTKGDDMNLAAHDVGNKAASETLFDAAHREVSQQTAIDKTAIGDGNVCGGLTQSEAAHYSSTLANTQFLASCIEHIQNKAEVRMSSIPAIAA